MQLSHNMVGVRHFISEIVLDDKEKILNALEKKKIYTLYDFLSSVTSFKFVDYVETVQSHKCKTHGETIEHTNGIPNGEFRGIIQEEPIGEENTPLKEEDNTQNTFHKNEPLEPSLEDEAILNNTKHTFSNGFMDPSKEYTNGTVVTKNELGMINGTNKVNGENNTVDKIKMIKINCENERTNGEIAERKKKTDRNDYACFSIIIHPDLIKTLPISDRNKNKLIKYIQNFINENDMYAVCIHFNFKTLFEKLEQLHIKNMEDVKKVLETKSSEWIKKNFEISNFEIAFLSNFIGRIKVKRVLCNCYEYGDNNREKYISEIKRKNGKIICDKIHQFVEFDKWIFENIIDNPFFQRLRHLSQLGACQYVYPGATHTRFEHSLGVGFLSAKYFTHFANELNISLRDREVNRMLMCVQIAGLCHDLGHGPFSHTFESFYVNYKKKKSERKWNHERMSLKIVERIVENIMDNSEVLDRNDIKTIQKLIYGRPCYVNNSVGLDPIDSLLEASFDIVCNNLNGLDADKFDYLQRDATIAPNNGTLPALNCNRLCDRSTIVDSRIVYNKKEIHTVWSVYLNRFSMFKHVYTHDKIRAMELMLCDGFRLSDHIFHWTDVLENIDTFLDFTDYTIIMDIKREAKRRKADEKMKHAANLINAVVCNRNSDYTYRFIDNFNITEPSLINYFKEITTESRIARYADGLNPEDIVIDWNDLNYGMGPKDPFDFVYFINSGDRNTVFRANAEDRGTYPKYFQEYNVRLYCKNKKATHLANEAFRHFKTTDVYPIIEKSHRNVNDM